MIKINRRPGTQDVSWFLDQDRYGRLDVDPPYQRRSVWTSKDRRYFLDTLFRGYPCPPIYLHKTIDAAGASTFHVVDGKQRIETILKFASNKLRIPENYGDSRLDNKRWKDIIDDVEVRNRFLNYPFVVEYFDDLDGSVVNEIFERMNKNSRKLTPQELRNARFDGWFSTEVEREVEEPVWRDIGIVTTGRARRMADVQFIAELFMITIYGEITGFDHAEIDKTYAKYEDLDDPDLEFVLDEFKMSLALARIKLSKIYSKSPTNSRYLSSVSNIYSLWALIVIHDACSLEDGALAERYHVFMQAVYQLQEQKKDTTDIDNVKSLLNFEINGKNITSFVVDYYNANQSATTELPQRAQRLGALVGALTP